jgi:hypothetical protein
MLQRKAWEAASGASPEASEWSSPDYRIPEGIVLAEANVTTHGKVTYLPVYLAGSLWPHHKPLSPH